MPELTDEQAEFIANYYRYMPVIISNSPMNIICRRIEKLAAEVKERAKLDEFDYTMLKFPDAEYTKEEYRTVVKQLGRYVQARRDMMNECEEGFADGYSDMNEYAEKELLRILPDVRVTVNILIDHFYRDKPTKSRDILWGVFGRYIVRNLNKGTVQLPCPDENGDIEYLGERYSLRDIKTEI